MQTLGNTTKRCLPLASFEAGVPLMKYSLQDHYSVRRCDMPGMYLAMFAGISAKRLVSGSSSSSGRITEGFCKAQIYIPTAAMIAASGSPYATPIVGRHLLPYGDYLFPCVFNTGIVLQEDLTSEDTDTTYATDGGAVVEIEPGVVDSPVMHLLWTGPVAADDDLIKTISYSGDNTDKTVTTFAAQPTEPRVLTVDFSAGTAGDIKAVTVTVYGLDVHGNEISDTFLATVNTATTVTGTKAFLQVTRVTAPAHDGDTVTVKVGISAKLGLAFPLSQKPPHILTRLDHTNEGTAPTYSVDPATLCKNFVALNSALNGKAVESWVLRN